MKSLDMIQRMKKMDKLITQKETGTPKEFAKEIGISESRLFDILVLIKKIGAPIRYSMIQKTYINKERENLF